MPLRQRYAICWRDARCRFIGAAIFRCCYAIDADFRHAVTMLIAYAAECHESLPYAYMLIYACHADYAAAYFMLFFFFSLSAAIDAMLPCFSPHMITLSSLHELILPLMLPLLFSYADAAAAADVAAIFAFFRRFSSLMPPLPLMPLSLSLIDAIS